MKHICSILFVASTLCLPLLHADPPAPALRAALTAAFHCTDAATHCVLTIPAVPAGTYSFTWIACVDGRGGNGNNGQVFLGFGDNFTGFAGGPQAAILSGCTWQGVTLSPSGSNSVSTTMTSGTPGMQMPVPSGSDINTQTSLQTGRLTLTAPGDVQIYATQSAWHDSADVAEITLLVLILEPAPPLP